MVRAAVLQLSELAGEMKRRHVFRVALAYGVVGWGVLEVAAATFRPLGIPEWANSLLAMFLILGFPMAMVLAWAYDITPAGVQRTAGSALAVRRGDAERKDVTLAVAALPFADVSPDRSYGFLGDGMADELINSLARQRGLRVVGRTSSFSFGSNVPDARQVGTLLGVAYVVEGSVRVADGRLRVTAQLIETASGYVTWSGSYDRPQDDLMAVQAEVARSVAGALPALLRGMHGAPQPPRRTADVDAYTDYLRGRQLWNQRTPPALESAIGHFRNAAQRDDAFALAHAGIADCLGILVEYGVVAPRPALDHAAAAVRRALERDDGAAEPHAADALVRQLSGDWAGAARGLRNALERDTSYGPALQRQALLMAWMGDADAAMATIDAARQQDPLSAVIATSRAWVMYFAGQHAGAAALLHDVLAENPGFTAARVPLAEALLQLGRPADAAAALDEHLRTTVRTPGAVALHIHALARAGEVAPAMRRMAALERLARRRHVSPYHLAVAAAGLRRHDHVLALLEQAVTAQAPQLIYLPGEPLFDPLRAHPRFSALLRRLPQAV